MRRRLYFLVHDLKQARAVFEKLLLARIHDNHIRFLAKEGFDIGDLPEATTFQKNDVIHSLFVGLGIGAIVGIIAGVIGHSALGVPIGGVMLAATLLGAILGAWSASMIGMMVPNRRLSDFYPAIEKGRILVIVDVPLNKVNLVKDTIQKSIPTVNFAGIEPTMPSVP